ncbi:MAG: hypothetical protein ACIALR_04540, partial [Blastopirellula sp. JB062]
MTHPSIEVDNDSEGLDREISIGEIGSLRGLRKHLSRIADGSPKATNLTFFQVFHPESAPGSPRYSGCPAKNFCSFRARRGKFPRFVSHSHTISVFH